MRAVEITQGFQLLFYMVLYRFEKKTSPGISEIFVVVSDIWEFYHFYAKDEGLRVSKYKVNYAHMHHSCAAKSIAQ